MSEKLTRTQQKNLERLGGINPAELPIPRRRFLTGLGGAAAVVGGSVGAGLLLKDNWGMKGVEPPKQVRLANYVVDLPASRPSMVVVRSNPLDPKGYDEPNDLLLAREAQ